MSDGPHAMKASSAPRQTRPTAPTHTRSQGNAKRARGLGAGGIQLAALPPATAANSKTSPKPNTASAAPASNMRPAIRARPEPLEYLTAAFLARTAVLASAAVVVAVPSDIAKTANTPVEKIPCAKAKTRTRIAPEQGRDPAAIIVKRALFQENPAPSERGSGA